MDAQEHYIRLGTLLAEVPDLEHHTAESDRWLAQANALVELGGDKSEHQSLRELSNRHTYQPRMVAKLINNNHVASFGTG